ncbi:copper homeostasis protein CutC [uncultured Solobacterium sp.]|uniref:copper homeostasis protein CutC n=1 Tax=uncultured Solobacterium sp. TaxID=747375 RepID=UPI001CB6599F|nr:copper homeostasis protein CutC [uncultured Solobacterium sp.]MBF1102984.1 copper homeostasis protein CutC [Solobacterium sp.]
MKRDLFEVCAGSVQDCINAQLGGADRVELNSALHLGGLTPSLAMLKLVKEKTSLKVICMDRPRAAGFCYDDVEIETMFEDAKILLENGADGISFGFLNSDATINVTETKKMVELIHQYQKEAVFHRAFDCVDDPMHAIKQLIDCGVDRILTSGLQPTAMQGASVLEKLQSEFGNRIELLAGSGINANNIRALKEQTGLHQFHGSCKEWCKDPTTTVGNVSYAYHESDDYDCVSLEKVKSIVQELRGK